MSDFAKESGHWYQRDGSPCYTMTGKNGKERNTTLRDARTMDLLPSVTTIMREANKPGLNNWLVDQAILAALTLAREENESDKSYLARVKKDAAEHGKQAAEKGTHIHGVVERGLSGETVPIQDAIFVELAKAELDKECPNVIWSHEKSFAADRFAGKCDLHGEDEDIEFSEAPDENQFVLDIKTNEKPVDKAVLYDEHYMQLAAYSVGLFDGELVQCGILFINHRDMESKIVWADAHKLNKGWEMFKALTDFWYAKTQLGR